jgi:hypothetical protein
LLLVVEGFCFCSWRLKVLVFALGGWRFLLIFLDVEGFYFYFLMLKVIAFTFGFSKFLLLFLNIESSYFYSWMLKVFVFGCTSKLCIQGKIFSKIPKIVIQFTWF